MQSCKMGAQASVDKKPPPQQLQREKLNYVRIVVAGCSYKIMVEKLINKFINDEYSDRPLICNTGINFETKMSIIDDEIVRLRVFDESHSLRYRGISTFHFRGNNIGLMVLYDVRDEQSFKTAQDLILTNQHYQVCMW